ncbi:O-antigen ligase family protein [Clostridium sp. BJN0013]|uniref:O-antigen ligase family protein n=1 Tax=Clostridium sp. BJN0013 TaxID=3236840 RepID=UPI0034C6D126
MDRLLYLFMCAYVILLPLLSSNKMSIMGIHVPPADCILALIILVYIVKFILSKECRGRFFSGIKDFFTSYLTIFISILALMMLISISYAGEKTIALSESFRFISYIVLFFIIKYEYNKKELLNGILGSYIAVSAVLCIYGIYQYFTGFGLNEKFENYGYAKFKIMATMDNPNNLAAFLVLAIFPIIMLSIYEKERIKKLFYILLTIIMLLNIAFTGSRNAIVGIVVGMIVLIVLYSLKLIIPLFVVAAAALFVPGVRDRILDISDPVQNQSRIYLWSIAKKMIVDHPIFGVGNGNYVSLYNKYVEIYPQYKFYGYSRYPCHNSYLKIESELGIIGGISFVAVLISSLIQVKTFINTVKSNFYKYFYTGFLASMIAFYVMNLFDNLFFVPKTTTYFWILLAVSQGMMYREKNNSIFIRSF